MATTTRLGNFALVMAPLFAVVVAVLTALEWEFLHEHGWGLVHSTGTAIAWPSGLADGAYGWVQVANFALLGLAVLGLAYGLRVAGPSGRVAPLLVGAMGLCLVAAAAKTDLGEPETWHGYVHAFASLLLFALSIVAMGAVWWWLRRDAAWAPEARLSAAMAPLALVALVLAFLTPGSIAFCFYLAVLLAWIALLGRRLAAADGRG